MLGVCTENFQLATAEDRGLSSPVLREQDSIRMVLTAMEGKVCIKGGSEALEVFCARAMDESACPT